MDIARVEDLLDMLKEERNDEEFFIAQHKRLLSRVHALPPEILLIIFRLCNSDYSVLNRPMFSFRSEMPMPWVLSAVCRRWKSILRDSPSEWASFDVDTWSQKGMMFLGEALRLSQRAPLHFTIYLRDVGGSDARFQALVEHADRWESVNISGWQEAFTSLGDLGCMPMLKKLQIRLSDLDSGGADLTTILSQFGACPQLHELSVDMYQREDAPVDLQTAIVSIPWANLSKLSVSVGPRTSNALRSLLVACTGLRQFDICGFRLDCGIRSVSLQPTPPLSHQGITSLTIGRSPIPLNHTTFPALTHICILGIEPPTLIPFLSRHPHITHFELRMVRDTSPLGWESALQLLPDILHFTFRFFPEMHLQWTDLSKAISARLPNLHTVTIDVFCHLLTVCDNPDIVIVGASRSLRRLEIYTKWIAVELLRDPVYGVPALHGVEPSDLRRVVCQMIEESTMIKALRGFQEGGLEVCINGIPLTDRSAMLYM